MFFDSDSFKVGDIIIFVISIYVMYFIRSSVFIYWYRTILSLIDFSVSVGFTVISRHAVAP